MSRHLPQGSLVLLLALAACGRGDNGDRFVSRDSSGVAIIGYPASAWDSAPGWSLSALPSVVLGGDTVNATVDLGGTVAGTLLRDGHAVISTNSPAEVLLFGANGTLEARLGAPGDGPGEYRVISQLAMVGSDSLLAYDATQRKVLYFAPNGMPLGELKLPPIVSTALPLWRGRLADGTMLLSLDLNTTPPAADATKPFRNPLHVLGLKPGATHYDTLFTGQGIEMVPSTIMLGGEVTPVAKPLIFGAATQVAVHGNLWYFSSADQFAVEYRDATGRLLRVVRLNLPPRTVGPADQEKYKATVREAYQRVSGSVSPEVLAAELKKLDETAFADHFPAIAQMLTDPDGNLWVNRGFSLMDRERAWLVFDPKGSLIGRVNTPLGSVLAVSQDRVLLRRDDPVSRRVRLEVFSLTRPASGATPPDSAGH